MNVLKRRDVINHNHRHRRDLLRGRLRLPRSGVMRKDPVRALRAARFLAQLPWLELDRDTRAEARTCARALRRASAERVREELDRLLTARDPRRGLDTLEELDLLDAVLRSPWAALVPSVYDREFPEEHDAPEPASIDLLHANYVEVTDGSLESTSRLYAKGNLVVCLRTMNAVAVVEPAGGDVLWLWGPGHLRRPHHPALLENGNVLVFSNGFDRSEVLEVEP